MTAFIGVIQRSVVLSLLSSAAVLGAANGATFAEGVNVDAGNTVRFYSYLSGSTTEGIIGADNGAIQLYSNVSESAQHMWNGGVVISGQPVSIILGNWNPDVEGQFRIYSADAVNYGADPLFEIDSVAMSAAFEGLSVSIDGSEVLTESSDLTAQVAAAGFMEAADFQRELSTNLPAALHNLDSLEFWGSSASGTGSFAGGAGTTASGIDSFAMSIGSNASGDYSVAFAGGQAVGVRSFAQGYQVRAEGMLSYASGILGSYAKSTGGWARGVGVKVEPNGGWSTSFGLFNNVTGGHSFSAGRRLEVNAPLSAVFGCGNMVYPVAASDSYSFSLSDVLFQVGNGDPISGDRSDAMVTTKAGKTRLINKGWSDASPLSDVSSDYGDGEALVVEGHTRLRGRVIIEEPQGDISMGIFE